MRLMDKMTRIGNLMDSEAKSKDESIFDTIQDAINYSAILLHALRIEDEKKRRILADSITHINELEEKERP